MRALRWILMVPGALLAMILVFALNVLTTFLAFWPFGQGQIGWFISRLFFSYISGSVFVLAGIWISPSRTATVGYALAGMMILFAGASLALGIREGSWVNALEMTVEAAGAVVFAYQYNKEPYWHDTSPGKAAPYVAADNDDLDA